MPVFYECQRCTACCRWPGQVRLGPDELARLADFLGLTENAFIQRYTRLDAQRRGLALQDKPNGECIFLDGNDCRVQPVKPQQCRDFPNLWRRPDAPGACQARPREVNEATYRQLILEATGRRLPSRDPQSEA